MARRKPRKAPKRAKRARRPAFKVRTVRRDRFGRFNPRGRTVQRVRIPIVRRPMAPPRRPALAPPRGAVSLVDDVHPFGRVAFLARDQRPDVADTFVGRDKVVTASLVFGYTDPRTGRAFDVRRVISFEAGDDEDDFWDNYHQAVREELEDVSDMADTETSGRYSRFGISVTHFA